MKIIGNIFRNIFRVIKITILLSLLLIAIALFAGDSDDLMTAIVYSKIAGIIAFLAFGWLCGVWQNDVKYLLSIVNK
ncbi:MAG: hypothetical protein IKU29_11790 [Parabacteroides sp.]|nr:hypothetical protein [Parabacteroides sp.]